MKGIKFLMIRLLVFCSPFILLTIVYIITDPFMIIYDYTDFNKRQCIQKNRDFVSTEMLMNNSPKYKYDSFIFGSSTALYTPPSIWKNYIKTQNNIFSFDASAENIIGIWSKIKYLDENNYELKNALITIDPSIFGYFNNTVPIFMKHYKVYPSSRFYFQYEYFLNFFDLRFLIAVVHYKISRTFYSYMGDLMDTQQSYYDTITNEYHNIGILNELKKDSVNYYLRRTDRFPIRSGKYTEANEIISHEDVEMLNEIRNVFRKNNTNYRIIICPSYDQVTFNKNDLAILKKIFDETYLYDFTGINAFTYDKGNFYDAVHFKKYIGKQLLDIAYRKTQLL